MDAFEELIILFMGILMTYLFVLIIIWILLVIANWKIFTKAGEEGWKSLIPIYSTIVLMRIVGINPWFILLMIFGGAIPIVGPFIPFAMYVWLNANLSKSFGHDLLFTLGLIFLPNIFTLILAFGSSQYVGPTSGFAGQTPGSTN